jgi:hypothetical protein
MRGGGRREKENMGVGVMKVGGERDKVRWQQKKLVNHPLGCFDGSKKNREWANM